MKRILLFLLASFASAQTLTLTGAATINPGNSIVLTLTSASFSGQNITSLGWTATPASGQLGPPAIGAVSTSAAKVINCAIPVTKCVAIPSAVSNTALGSGVIATFSLFVPIGTASGSLAVPLSSLAGYSTTAVLVPITSGSAYSVTVGTGNCDVNRDGAINYADVSLLSQNILAGTCPGTYSPGCTAANLAAVIVAASSGTCSI